MSRNRNNRKWVEKLCEDIQKPARFIAGGSENPGSCFWEPGRSRWWVKLCSAREPFSKAEYGTKAAALRVAMTRLAELRFELRTSGTVLGQPAPAIGGDVGVHTCKAKASYKTCFRGTKVVWNLDEIGYCLRRQVRTTDALPAREVCENETYCWRWAEV